MATSQKQGIKLQTRKTVVVKARSFCFLLSLSLSLSLSPHKRGLLGLKHGFSSSSLCINAPYTHTVQPDFVADARDVVAAAVVAIVAVVVALVNAAAVAVADAWLLC